MNKSQKKMAGVSLVIVLLITALWLVMSQEKILSRNSSSANENMVQIHILLYELSTECRYGKFERAQNTFLDLQQEWRRAELTNDGKRQLGGLTADSLAVLEQNIDKVVKGNKKFVDKTVLEIKRINDKLN